MGKWQIKYTSQAYKDAKKIEHSPLRVKLEMLLAILQENPWQTSPPFEKLIGDLEGYYSRRINLQHRLVYQVYIKEKIIKIHRMWTHYE